MISEKVAQRFASTECLDCKGLGILTVNFGQDEEYCMCVQQNKAEHEGEMQFELNRDN